MPLILDGAFALIESTLAGEVLDEASADEVAKALDVLAKNSRDRRAQNEFARVAQPLLMNMARSAARRHPNLDPDDLVQEVLLRVTKGRVGRSWRGGSGSAAKSFLGTLIKSVMRDEAKKAKRKKRGGDERKFSIDAPPKGKDGEGGFDPKGSARAPSARMQDKEIDSAIKRVVSRFTKDPKEQMVLALWMSAVKGERSDLLRGGKPNTRAIGREAGIKSANPGRDADKIIARFMKQAQGSLRPFMDDINLVVTFLAECVFGIDRNSPWLTTEAACDLLEGALLNG